MAFEPEALSDREKTVLRLLSEGHDAKSTARQLGISIHAVNERLRGARRKLQVSSSREAARLLARSERQDTNSFVDEKIGVVAPSPSGESQSQHGKVGIRNLALAAGGLFTVSIAMIIAMLATTASQTAASGPLPNWSLQSAVPGKLARQSNRIHLSGNGLLWNGNEVSEDNVRTFLGVETQMSPQPATILSYGSKVVPGRVERMRQLIDQVLHCKPSICVEVTKPVDDGQTAPKQAGPNSSR